MTTNKPPPKQPYPVRVVSRDAYAAILADELLGWQLDDL
jgi:hypothetical protein